MRIDIVTLFPAMVEPVLAESMLGRARARGLVDIRVVNLRDYAAGKHRVTDDYQFGGGGGMVLKPEPLFAAVAALRTPGARVILMDPRGRLFTQDVARDLAREQHLIMLAGRYEGVDERVAGHLADDTISIGDYVLTGGEVPALVVTDAVTRLLPGVLGAEGAAERESFASGLLEPPQYTRPEDFHGLRVPAVLLSGDHARIAAWRHVQALWRTWRSRPDLIEGERLDAGDRAIVDRFIRGETPEDVVASGPRGERDTDGRASRRTAGEPQASRVRGERDTDGRASRAAAELPAARAPRGERETVDERDRYGGRNPVG